MGGTAGQNTAPGLDGVPGLAVRRMRGNFVVGYRTAWIGPLDCEAQPRVPAQLARMSDGMLPAAPREGQA